MSPSSPQTVETVAFGVSSPHPQKFQKRPVTIEAFQWTGTNTTEILHWMFPDIEPDAVASNLTIKTLEGEMKAHPGDWIIKGVKGEFYPCRKDIFEETYQKVR